MNTSDYGLDMSEREYLTPKKAAGMLGYHEATLAKMRSVRTGPRFIKNGNRIWYDLADIHAWLDSLKVETSPRQKFELADAVSL